MHQGDTYRVLDLDLESNIARLRRVEVDYYTQPLGGTDIHHVDHCLRQKPFGTGTACWGEVTAYFTTWGYDKIHFYSLDPISRHSVKLPELVLETMASWVIPPEWLMQKVRAAGLDAHSGLRGIGYATRMLLPLFITCDTLDFSHTVGSVNLNCPDTDQLADTHEGAEQRLEKALRRRLERMREPQVLHPLEPSPQAGYPEREKDEAMAKADVERRAERRRDFSRELRRRIARSIPDERLKADAGRPLLPPGMKTKAGNKPPTHFPGRPPASKVEEAPQPPTGKCGGGAAESAETEGGPIRHGDPLAALARRTKKRGERNGPKR